MIRTNQPIEFVHLIITRIQSQ